MMKGIPQEKRDNAWHNKHLKKMSKFNAHRPGRVLNYSSGATASAKNKKRALEAMERQRERDIKKGFFQKIWMGIRFFWIMSGIKARGQMRRLLNIKHYA